MKKWKLFDVSNREQDNCFTSLKSADKGRFIPKGTLIFNLYVCVYLVCHTAEEGNVFL